MTEYEEAMVQAMRRIAKAFEDMARPAALPELDAEQLADQAEMREMERRVRRRSALMETDDMLQVDAALARRAKVMALIEGVRDGTIALEEIPEGIREKASERATR